MHILSGRLSRELGRMGHNASMNDMAFELSEVPTATTKGENQTATIGGSGEMWCPMTEPIGRGRRQAHWRP
jgi:hypothetical protein